MISYTLKQILTLVPEAFDMVKQANLEEDFPLGNKGGCIASALRAQHDKYIGRKSVDEDMLTKIAMAVEAYGVESQVMDLTSKMMSRSKAEMVKCANEAASPEKYMEKQAQMDAGLYGYKDIQSLVKQAEALHQESEILGKEPTDNVLRYSCDAWLDKEAAITGLNHRYHLTKNDTFVKLAAALGKEEALVASGPLVKSFCETVTRMDKQAGLDFKGFDIYQESLLTKTAAYKAMRVSVGNKEYPIEKIMSIPRHHIKNYLGEDVAKGMTDPMTTKAVIESLPADMHSVLNQVIRSC